MRIYHFLDYWVREQTDAEFARRIPPGLLDRDAKEASH
jgi:hypothetical protein